MRLMLILMVIMINWVRYDNDYNDDDNDDVDDDVDAIRIRDGFTKEEYFIWCKLNK